MKTKYHAVGSVRGECGHKHAMIGAAERCRQADSDACGRLGGGAYSDREVERLDGEPLTGAELDMETTTNTNEKWTTMTKARYDEVCAKIQITRALFNASNMRRSAGVFGMLAELDRLTDEKRRMESSR